MRYTLLILAALAGYYIGAGNTQEQIDRAVSIRELEIADCSLEDAQDDVCFIPCTTDTDCVEKNGRDAHASAFGRRY